MEQKIKVKCPRCGANLSVKMQPGIEHKNLTCPVCKESSIFSSYRVITPPKEQEREHTIIKENIKSFSHTPEVVGELRVLSSTQLIRLRKGKNIIGRKASNSSADCQIETDNRRISREHLIIEVKNVEGKGVVHMLSLYKEQVNPTSINGESLMWGDSLVLRSGDVITLADLRLRFEIPDDEKTEVI